MKKITTRHPMIISSTTDIATYIDDARADVRDYNGQTAVDAAVEALRTIDHPAWGSDWSDWLAEPATQRVLNVAIGAHQRGGHQ